MLFADLVAVSGRVQALDARQDKVVELSAFFRTCSASEVPMCAELLLRDELFADRRDDPPRSDEVEPREHPSLTCEAVVDALDEIDRAPASALRRNLTHQLLARATIDEQRWIAGVTRSDRPDLQTFDLVVSSAARTARVAVGALRRAASLTGSLPLTVRIAFERGGTGLESVTIEPGRPIVPTPSDVTETPEVLLDLAASHLIEFKPRADRIQVHRVRGDVFVYDDRLRDVTHEVPGVVEQVTGLARGDLVLDGWVDLAAANESESSDVASWTRRRGADGPGGPARFFDIMFDGASIIDEPLANRRALLASVVPEHSLLPTLEISSLDDVARALNECMSAGHDGLIVKPRDDPYECGVVKSAWRTIEASHVVKLAVTAAERGSGSRSDLLSSVHLAARDDRGRFHDVGKTTRGLSEQTIAWQTAAFANLVLEGESGRVSQLRPGVISVVAIDGVARSDQLPGGLTVVQPRVLGYQQGSRSEVTSVDDLREISDRDAGADRGSGRGDGGERDDSQPALPSLPTAPPTDFRPEWPAPGGGFDPGIDAVPPTLPLGTRTQASIRGRRAIAELQPYEEPVIPTSTRPWRAVLAARAATVVWVLAILITALVERADANGTDGDSVALVGRIGLVVVLLLTVTGWAWSDQLVRTLTQLDGRRPGRARCVSAWVVPPVTVLLIALLVVPLDPTEPADVRPLLIVPVFALVMWRPYSLLRRILATLIRLRSDALIASAYIIDLLGFGVIWWQLTQWEDRAGEVSSGRMDVLVGTVAAVSISTVMGLMLWIGLLRTARNAVAHRRSSQRTRYEHRMLRLSGVDPTDPEVWWALVQRRADEERAAAAREEDAADRAALPTVDQLIEGAREEHSVAFRRLDDDEAAELEERLRREFTAILAERGVTPDLRRGDLIAPESSAASSAPSRSDLEELINQAGSLEIESALAAHRERANQDQPTERLLPPRLFALEASRVIMVATFGALTLAAGWLVAIALGSDAIGGSNQLAPSVLEDIDLARRLIWSLLTIGGALVPFWALMVLRQARLAGLTGLRELRVWILFLVAAAACAIAFVIDADRGGPTLLLSLPIIWTAVSAGFAVEPVRLWYEIPAATLMAWIATLPAILAVAWLAGLADVVTASASLQRLAFATILLTLGCARVTVMSWLSSVDLEDEFRVAPELAVPARAAARR